jgi:acetolactate synthase-1/2/3 large subunit
MAEFASNAKGNAALTTGIIGMHGSQASNMACDACDLLIAVGCRFSDRVALEPTSFAKQAQIVQIDIDRAEINKNVEVDHHIIGDAKRVLQLLNERVEPQTHEAWKDYVFSFKTETEYDTCVHENTLTPKQISDTVASLCPQDTVVATDVGQHQMWVIQHFHYDYPGQLLTSGGFGTMGFGLGAAIGAKVGNPDKTVIHITGDGCFRMNCHELCTEQFYNLPVITIVYNNGTLGMVRQWQTLTYNGHYSQTTLDRGPDFVKHAEAYGLKGKRVHTVPELEEAMKEALSCGHGYVIDCAVEIDEMVRPMVPVGGKITQFLVD